MSAMDLEEFRIRHWRLRRNLFGLHIPERRFLDKVFTGRMNELETTRVTLNERPRNVLIKGFFGVGKTIFIKEL